MEDYRRLEYRLEREREKTDHILNEMDEVWDDLTDEEKQILED